MEMVRVHAVRKREMLVGRQKIGHGNLFMMFGYEVI